MSQALQERDISERGSLARRIRRFAFPNYVAAMRDAPGAEVRFRARDVHKRMGPSRRMPAVCGALDSIIFHREYGLELARCTVLSQGANENRSTAWDRGRP
jgi:hypothetical protein